MSAYGGPQTADLEREERAVDCEAGWGDGDTADDPEPVLEPLKGAAEPVRVVGAVCGRWRVENRHGSSWHPCFGRITEGGGCSEGCVPR